MNAVVPLRAVDAQRGQRMTDMGNSERMVEQQHDRLRFCHAQDAWYIWDGSRWAHDDGGQIMRLADDVVKNLYAEAARLDGDARQALGRWAARSEDLARRRAMVQGAQHLAPVRPDALDVHPYLLNVANGVLDLRSGELGPHAPGLLLTHLVDINYLPDAICPTWLHFLDTILGGDPALIGYVRRAFGYTLTGDTGEQVMFLPYGSGANGKTTMLEVLRALLGGLARTADPSMLLTSKRDSGAATPGLAALRGVRAALVSEVNQGNRLDAATVKWITGGEVITARFLHRDLFEFRPQFHIWLAVNHKPEITDTSEGMWRRLHAIPFTVTIPQTDRDPHLLDRLLDELPGILTWAVQGCLEWQQQGLNPPPQVLAATATYRADSDPVAQFLAEWCDTDPDASHLYIGKPALWDAYVKWCAANTTEPISQKALTQALKDKGYSDSRTAQTRIWRGIALKGG